MCGSHLLLQYVRYIQWFINAPLVLLALFSFVTLATPVLLIPLFFSWYLVVNGLIGALVTSSYKWGFFVFGLFGLFFVWCVAVCVCHVVASAHPSTFFPRTPGGSCWPVSAPGHSQTMLFEGVTSLVPGTSPLYGCCTRSVGVSLRVATKSRPRRKWCSMGSWIFCPVRCSS